MSALRSLPKKFQKALTEYVMTNLKWRLADIPPWLRTVDMVIDAVIRQFDAIYAIGKRDHDHVLREVRRIDPYWDERRKWTKVIRKKPDHAKANARLDQIGRFE
jgi:hypothetical protein